MIFCPICANCLLMDKNSGRYRFFCNTCSFFYPIDKPLVNTVVLKTKQVDDIIGAEVWETASKTEAPCPKCSSKEAYFFQMQTRSADEPMTIFYKCVNQECKFNWRE